MKILPLLNCIICHYTFQHLSRLIKKSTVLKVLGPQKLSVSNPVFKGELNHQRTHNIHIISRNSCNFNTRSQEEPSKISHYLVQNIIKHMNSASQKQRRVITEST